MPRGVYDRSKRKQQSTQAAEKPAKVKKGKPGRKKTAAAVTSASVSNVTEQSQLLSTHLTALAHARASLLEGAGQNVIAKTEGEILATVEAIAALRRTVVGDHGSEEEQSNSNGTVQSASVPLPPQAPGAMPVPPVPAA